MAIKSGDYLGLWIPAVGHQFELYAQSFGTGKLFVSQKVTKDGYTGYVIRSQAFVGENAVGFQKAGTWTAEDLTALEAGNTSSDPHGLLAPSTFTAPTGWAERFDTDGTKYYVNLDDKDLDGVSDSGQSSSTSWGSKAMDFVKQYWHYILIAVVFIYLLWASSLPKKRRKKATFGIL